MKGIRLLGFVEEEEVTKMRKIQLSRAYTLLVFEYHIWYSDNASTKGKNWEFFHYGIRIPYFLLDYQLKKCKHK